MYMQWFLLSKGDKTSSGSLFTRHPTSEIKVLYLLRSVLSLSSCSATTHTQGALFLDFCKLGLCFIVHYF